MWYASWNTVACFVACLAARCALAVDRRPLMRRGERRAKPKESYVQSAMTTLPPRSAHGPHSPLRLEVQNISNLARTAPAVASSALWYDKVAPLHARELQFTTPMPTWPPVVGTVPARAAEGRAKGSIIIGSSGVGDALANAAAPMAFVSAGFMDLNQVPTGTTSGMVTTPAMATTPLAAAGIVTTPMLAAAAPGAVAAPADASSGGMSFFEILFILIAAIGLGMGASAAYRFYTQKKVAGRLDGVNKNDNNPESQFWKTAKARQTYRKSQLSVPTAGGDDDSDQGSGASGQGRGMIQQDTSSAAHPKAGSYRDRKVGAQRRAASEPREKDDAASNAAVSDQEPVPPSSSYRGRRAQQQVKRDSVTRGSDDVTV